MMKGLLRVINARESTSFSVGDENVDSVDEVFLGRDIYMY